MATAWALFSGCEGSRTTSGPQEPALLQSAKASFEQRVLLTGEIDAVSAAELRVPPVENGRATLRWLAEMGAAVKKGDRVAEFDNSSFATELQQKVIAVSQAESQLQKQLSQAALSESEKVLDVERKRIAVDRARINADMPADLFSKRDVLEAKLALTKAEADLVRAKEALATQRRTAAIDRDTQQLGLARARRELETLEQGIERLALRAPLDGIVLVGDHREGRPLQVGDEVLLGMVVAKMPDLAQIRVKAFLADVDDGKVAVGMPAEVTVDAYPGQTFKARVDAVSAIAREPMEKSLRRVFEVGLTLEGETDSRLRPGLSARVEVIAHARSEAIVVPRQALRFSEDDAAQVRPRGEKEKPITLGPCNAMVCVVEEGLASQVDLASGDAS